MCIQIYASQGKLNTLINGEDVSHEIETVNSTSIQANNAFYLTRVEDNVVRVLLNRDTRVYVLTVTQRQNILDFVVNLEDSIMGTTEGLLGNFNGDNTDDFIMPNGIQILSDASDQMLHVFGQSCECCTDNLKTGGKHCPVFSLSSTNCANNGKILSNFA